MERRVWNCERRSGGAKGVARFVSVSAGIGGLSVSVGVGGAGLSVGRLGERGGSSGRGIGGKRSGAEDARFQVDACVRAKYPNRRFKITSNFLTIS